MAEKRGTCSKCDMMHDPHLPCPDDIYCHSDKRRSKDFKKITVKARNALIVIAVILFGSILLFAFIFYRK